MGGDRKEFDELYERCFARSYRVAYRILDDRCAAEDAASEALARAFLHWSTLQTNPYRDGWVVVTATNLALDALRRRRTLEHVLPMLVRRTPAPTGFDGVEFRTALRGLPRRQQQAFVLCRYEGYTRAEASKLLGISPKSIDTHIERALTALRVNLADI